ncbi:putative bifunctional diguanylate cyclase/phosphodiesterase [Roseibium sp.]|uniref:putative bifunctional diguanylate cyclase/phosphodiesterase n=1 Tax=Roseibium sp. TaxID=1936156 RepID=UPI003A980E43
MAETSRKTIVKFTVGGVLFGTLFPIIAVLLEYYAHSEAEDPFPVYLSHSPIMGIVMLAPLVLGITFHFIGRSQDALHRTLKRTQTAERAQWDLANSDPLTGQGNRHNLIMQIRRAISEQACRTRPVYVFLIDLDNFKFINDTLGHHIGDALLKALSERISTFLGPNCRLFRLGGDEFVVLDETAGDDPSHLAVTIINCMAEPFQIEGMRVVSGGSIGVTSLRPTDTDESDILCRADLALYKAKETFGNSYSFFDDSMAAEAISRMAIEQELRLALEGGHLFVEFQPIVDATTLKPSGFEALARWKHPERGTIAPADFIPIAEVSGLIIQLGEYILTQACIEAAKWAIPLNLSVNVSAEQFKNRQFYDQVLRALDISGLEPERLHLEVTESLFIQDIDLVSHTLDRLRELGVRFALDDFGTGFSSINHLRKLKLDTLKLDRSFAERALNDPREAELIETIIKMGQVFNLTITVEGIENLEQLETMRLNGISHLQGFYFSHPMSSETVRTELEALKAQTGAPIPITRQATSG